jgi:hypothetical protein
MTCLVTVIERRPRLLLSAPFFPFMRVLDAWLGLYAIPLAWLASSNGVWKSPARRKVRRGTVIAGPLVQSVAAGPPPAPPVRPPAARPQPAVPPAAMRQPVRTQPGPPRTARPDVAAAVHSAALHGAGPGAWTEEDRQASGG